MWDEVFSLGENYAVEIEIWGERFRDWADGVSFWNCTCNLDLFRDDHKPSFELRVEILNRTLFGVEVYNIHHLSPEEEKRRYKNAIDAAFATAEDLPPDT
jgi:hypothetical protein